MSKKITVIGFGNVGRVLVNLFMGSNHPIELNIMDPAEWLSGAFLDIKHSLGMQPNKRVHFNDREQFLAADFVFFTAGVPGKHGASRLTTVDANTELVRTVFHGKKLNPKMFVIAITNPVDVITAAIVQYSGLPANQVFGTGTFLDSMRFSFYLAKEGQVDYQDVNAMVLGEHGASCVPVVSHSRLKGISLLESDLITEEKIQMAFDQTLNAAFEIRKTESGTAMAVSHCALRLFEFLTDSKEHQVPVSMLLSAEWMQVLGLKRKICMSVPATISEKGIAIPAPLHLTEKELIGLKESAKVLEEHQKFLEA